MGAIEWVAHDDLRFKCLVSRAGPDAPWIVFSNSILTDLAVWAAQAEMLEGRRNALFYDQRGHGGTSVPPGPCTFDQLGSDLLALLDHFGIERATLVGLSMGVPTALYAVRHQPDRVTSLVLCDGQSATAPGGSDVWHGRIDTARTKGMDYLVDETSARWFSDAFRAAGRHEKVIAAAKATPLEGFVACARALQDYHFTDVLPHITVPTMLLVGANDGAMPQSMRKLAEAIPGAVLNEIPDAGHIPCYEQPDTFNRYLGAFLGIA